MSKRHHIDIQDDTDEGLYSWIGSRHSGIDAVDMGKLQRKWRNRRGEFENRKSARKPKRIRERFN
jgi:hypothetical protein